MKLPVQITFRNMNRSDAVEEWVLAEAAKLDRFYGRVMGCRVAIEVPHRHHKKGSPYHIRIDLTVPGEELVIKREPSLSHRPRQLGRTGIKKGLEAQTEHKSLRLAINDAFKAASRRLQDYARRQRGDIKNHVPQQLARVSKILPDEGYGFLTSDDGREVYFHKNSVLNRAFPRLIVGTKVRFEEEMGEKGLQASTVRVIEKRRIPPVARQQVASAD